MKNTPVLFDEMTRHLQLLFNPTDAGRIINKFTWSRTWNALVIYLLPPKAKFCEKLFLAHGKDKTLIWRWISANWDSTLEVQYRFCQQPKGVSTKPHIHSPCSPPPLPQLPSPPLTRHPLIVIMELLARTCENEGREFSSANIVSFALEVLRALTSQSNYYNDYFSACKFY